MEKSIAKKYALLDAKIKELEAQRLTMRVEILSNMQENDIIKEETLYGKFTRSGRTMWKYSKAVVKLQERVKVAQVKEQQKGTAKAVISDSLVFNKPKA